MGWLLRDNWLGSVLAFLLGATITWFLLDRRRPLTTTTPTPTPPPAPTTPPDPTAPTTSGQPTTSTEHAAPTPTSAAPGQRTAPAEETTPTPVSADTTEPAVPTDPAKPAPAPAGDRGEVAASERSGGPGGGEVGQGDGAGFSRLMDAPTLFDEVQAEVDDGASAVVPPGRYGEGSADAVPHQGPPDGYTIKGNAQSMLFHTPDSPYYGRTKPEVWFRTEADAERAGFTKYVRRPRKSADPSN